jgi:cyclopropane fatty-acyl-phospholipid synthase-like methyltransferase
MMDPRTQVVADGYDAIADHFLEWSRRIEGDERARWRDELARRLPEGARVLELGCGAGIADTRALARRFSVTGVDISPEQVSRARANVPTAEFMCCDFTRLELPAESFDAVVAFYSFNHVPRELLAGLLTRIHTWLVPDGLFLSAFGTGDTESWTGEWLGTSMFFSSHPPDTNRRLLREAGFTLELDDLTTMIEPEPDGESRWHWVLAHR